KKGVVLEPTYIVIQAPMGVRSQINRLGNLPITGVNGETVPLSELGSFIKERQDHIVYHKDLRAVEYVTGEMQGRLGAPIYGMFDVEDILENYVTPDGVTMTGMPMGLLGPPDDSFESGFEWGGEWTVTYETFRDMGGAFMAAMLLIYGLIVWEFKNFTLGGLIMAPIPLTLIGIIPGHWFANAEFTATSMIGFIALAGIVVRNSILLVEFVKHEVANGVEIREAVVLAGKARMRPILITALTLMAGAYMILDDLIFKGMAVSLLYGAGVATVLTLVVIPMGCISVSKQFYVLAGIGESPTKTAEPEVVEYKLPLWMRIYSAVINGAMWLFYIGRMFIMMARMGIQSLLDRFGSGSDDPGPASPDNNSGPAGGTPPPAPTPAPSGNAGSVDPGLEKNNEQAMSESGTVAQETKANEIISKKIVKKKAAPRKKATSVSKKVAPVKKAVPTEQVVSASKKKTSVSKKRRGIRLNPGLKKE
ncbi:MAG: efflux RND transporter permease subunit, partial [Gammaproteobacteria bacterium]|nr:efflux RND transporter permease subunit [Gammaproteobacteria bacterium]